MSSSIIAPKERGLVDGIAHTLVDADVDIVTHGDLQGCMFLSMSIFDLVKCAFEGLHQCGDIGVSLVGIDVCGLFDHVIESHGEIELVDAR